MLKKYVCRLVMLCRIDFYPKSSSKVFFVQFETVVWEVKVICSHRIAIEM